MDKLDSKHNGTGRYANDLPIINEILNDLLSPHGITAVYDHYSTTWVYHSDDPVFDRTKFTLLYAILQHYGKKIHGLLPITFIDDKEDIRESLALVFADNPKLIPKGVELTIWPYNGSLRFDFPIIPGSGPIDFNYKTNIRKLVEMCGHDMKKISMRALMSLSNSPSRKLNNLLKTEFLGNRPMMCLWQTFHCSLTINKNMRSLFFIKLVWDGFYSKF